MVDEPMGCVALRWVYMVWLRGNMGAIFRHLLRYPKIKVYEGSWTEWSNWRYKLIPRGPNPR